jgi:Ca2+/Na+ antiporter
LIPVVAIIGGDEDADDVAIGAILGAPLLLATIAMAPPRRPAMSTVVLQLFVALGAIVGGAEIFVEQLLHVADSLDLEPLLLSLALAPFATELPEKANSFFWVRDGKASLALGTSPGRWCSSRRCRFRSASRSRVGSSTASRA